MNGSYLHWADFLREHKLERFAFFLLDATRPLHTLFAQMLHLLSPFFPVTSIQILLEDQHALDEFLLLLLPE
ncbi:MAG: hypothetical protein ACK4VW_01020 [Anaerolineales bacterium]